ncbi:death domain-associated protein 6 [Diretmus argenteus]
MAVAQALMAESIIILDDDDEEIPQPSCSAATSNTQHPAKRISPLKAQQPVPTHITQSPFASAKKDSHVLLAENQRLFSEFVEHCTIVTRDCPEVLTFLHTKHTKASPSFLSSVEFRNTLGRCLTRAQANRSKTFVYINELCTVLRQHAAKRRQTLVKVKSEPSTSASVSSPSTSVSLKSKDKTKLKPEAEEEDGVEDEQPSTSELQDDREEKKEAEQEEKEKKTQRASRKQVSYLENLLKVYNDEIRRLQEKDLTLDDLEAEDSGYIQEHKLKRKMMKIYEKLCELKGCSTLTGRVIEQRIVYNSTRYPEINKKIERFINTPEAHRNPPDYPDILQQVLRANERYKLCLSRKQLNQITQEAFRETGSRLQERRHLDLVYNFGSHLTDQYKPATDPAVQDPSLLRKLRGNREVALSSLEAVITKYAVKQDDTEEQERTKRLEKEGHKSEKEGGGTKAVNGVVEEEEEEEDYDDVSSDPDIEEEIQASAQHGGPDDDEEEEDDSNEAEQANEDANKEEQGTELSGSVSGEEERSVKQEEGDEERSVEQEEGDEERSVEQEEGDEERSVEQEEGDEERSVEQEEGDEERSVEQEEGDEERSVVQEEEEEEKEPGTSGLSPVSINDNPGISPMSDDDKPGISPMSNDDKPGISPMSNDDKPGISPMSNDDKPGISPLSDNPSPRDSPSQSEPTQPDDEKQSLNGDLAGKEQAVDSSNHEPPVPVSTSEFSQDTGDLYQVSLPPSPDVILAYEDSTAQCDTQTTNGRSPPLAMRRRKRKWQEIKLENSHINHTVIHDSDGEIPLDMGVVSSSPPQWAESTRVDSPTQELVTSSQISPPPKKNKVNVGTQCDPDEIIVLSDSE